MKPFLSFMFIMLSLCVTVLAQDQSKQADTSLVTAAERFSRNAGTLIEKQFILVDEFDGLEFELATFTDLISGTSTKALRLELNRKSYNGNPISDVELVDMAELENLKKSILLIIEKMKSPGIEYTEVRFKTTSGVEFGAFSAGTRWGGFIQVEPADEGSTLRFDGTEYPEILRIIENVITKAKE